MFVRRTLFRKLGGFPDVERLEDVAKEVEAAGGKVMALPLEAGYSTTGIVEEILRRQP